MNYLHNIGTAMNRTARTENGAVALRTSNNALVDFFALAGATRNNPQLGLDLFKKALLVDRQKAIRLLFYMRDIRGGQGERKLFRMALAYLAETEPALIKTLAEHVPEYGRWDDLLVLPIDHVVEVIVHQLDKDQKTDTPSLLGKWLPSENTSSEATRNLAKQVRGALKMKPKQYRKMLSSLRAKIKLVETRMTQKEYAAIDYSKLPSQAGLKYRKAFFRNDTARYIAFLESLKKGETKVNTGTLYPHQLYVKAHSNDTTGIDELWANLPDYTQGKKAIVVADVSGSMDGEPMAVSVSLALYFAERNEGPFKDTFITFSGNPTLQKIKGDTLTKRMASIERATWYMNTDINKVFKILVDTAVATKADPSEMPETIYIISDMQFDACGGRQTNYEAIDAMYQGTDYRRPDLVFWNVRAAHKQVPVEHNTHGVTMVSGFSPTVFKLAVENKTPEQLMEDIVNSDRYQAIVIH